MPFRRKLPRPGRFVAAWGLLTLSCLGSPGLWADDADENAIVAAVRAVELPGVRHSAAGVTRRMTPLPCLVTADDAEPATPKTRVLLVGGMDGRRESVDAVLQSVKWFYEDPAALELRKRFAVSAVPCVNPDGIAAGRGTENLSGGDWAKAYPLERTDYDHPTLPEVAYLRRWIGMHAPDLVIELHAPDRNAKGSATENTPAARWFIPEQQPAWSKCVAKGEQVAGADEPPSLLSELSRTGTSDTAPVPGVRLFGATGHAELERLLERVEAAECAEPSLARRELARRVARTPIEVANQLSRVYGHELGDVVYIPAVALIGRLRLGELTGERKHRRDVERIVAAYLNGSEDSLPKSPAGVHFAGHLVFAELAELSDGATRERCVELARRAADFGFDGQGRPRASMPAHSEMSDAVFMGGPILARVGRLTGERRYFDQCVRHVEFMRRLCRRDDGLYRHSPLDETAWGRGNGFVALGLALCLGDLPEGHPGRKPLLAAFHEHMAALAKHQDETGCWHQVVDFDGSYRELSCTCMLTFALARGIRRGWLPRDEYEPVLRRAWRAALTRIGPDGGLVDVCTGTGKQPSLRAYLDRKAILGRDARGGAMALLAATEMAALERE